MTKRKVGGYAFRQELVRARNANTAARRAIGRLVREDPSSHTRAILLARAAMALAEIGEAVNEIERIAISENPGG
jgi:predicted Zn-dependent protease